LSQGVTVSQAGLYQASFFLGVGGNAIGGIVNPDYTIKLNGSVIAQQDVIQSVNALQEYTATFLADTGPNNIEFDFGYNGLLSIENISLEQVGGGPLMAARLTDAVPEPATWTMMLIGFGAVGFAMRRRKSVALAV
jgi:hypothetical protein